MYIYIYTIYILYVYIYIYITWREREREIERKRERERERFDEGPNALSSRNFTSHNFNVWSQIPDWWLILTTQCTSINNSKIRGLGPSFQTDISTTDRTAGSHKREFETSK